MGKSDKDIPADNSRRTILKKVAFVVPCLITFEVNSLMAESSGPPESKWTGGKPSAPK